MSNVLDFAREILEMEAYIERLETENASLRKYKELYHRLLNDDIQSGRQMIGEVIISALKAVNESANR